MEEGAQYLQRLKRMLEDVLQQQGLGGAEEGKGAGSATDLDPLGLSQRIDLNGLHQGQRLHGSLHDGQTNGSLGFCQLLPHGCLMLLLVGLAVLP